MKISLQRILTKDLATLAQRVIQISKNEKHQKTQQQNPLLADLEKKSQAYDEVYAKQIFSGKGKSVAEADEARDKAFVSVKNFLWGYRQVSSAPHSDKAKELYELIKGFGTDLDRLSYSAESAQMKKLIEELEKTENKTKLTALSLTTAFTELKMKQENFEQIYAEQVEANADLRKTPSATVLRRELEKTLRAYLDFVNIMKVQKDWEGVYQEINEIVKAARNSK